MRCVTVAICTWNRANLLDQTLTQMRKLRIPADVEWELLVVNNNCTDDTDQVIVRNQDSLPLVRLFEPRQGLSNARNCAVAAARGELLLWTDDDVLVEPEWLSAYVAAAEKWPEAGYFGGAIDPWYECSPPRWLLENIKHVGGMFVIKDLGQEERFLCETEIPFGANMAFRSEILRENQFHPSLGRKRRRLHVGRGNHALWCAHRQGNEGRVGTAGPRQALRRQAAAHARVSVELLPRIWSIVHPSGRAGARSATRENVGRRAAMADPAGRQVVGSRPRQTAFPPDRLGGGLCTRCLQRGIDRRDSSRDASWTVGLVYRRQHRSRTSDA